MTDTPQRVSIIVPVYNVAPWLEECIASLGPEQQNGREIILVDDGSTDQSGAICDQAAQRYPSVRVIHRRNGGLSAARNTGLKVATGRWILFVDADDILAPGAVETLLQAALSSQAQIIGGRMKKFKGEAPAPGAPSAIQQLRDTHLRKFTPREAVRAALYQQGINHSVCGKLFDAQLWSDVRFRQGILYEDLDIFAHVWLKATKIVDIDADLYYYRQREHSILHTFNPQRADVLDVTARITRMMKFTGDKELASAALDREFSANFNIMMLSRRGTRAEERLKKRCITRIRQLRKQVMRDSNSRLKNRTAALLSHLFF